LNSFLQAGCSNYCYINNINNNNYKALNKKIQKNATEFSVTNRVTCTA